MEGELDKLSMEEAGFKNVISVPSGAVPPRRVAAARAAAGSASAASAAPRDAQLDRKFAFLGRAAPVLAGVRAVLLAVDGDAPGRALAEELARRLGRARCFLLEWPAGCKDANDYLMGRDLEAAGLPGGGAPDPLRLQSYVSIAVRPMPDESLV